MSGRLGPRIPGIEHLTPASTAGTASIGLAVPAWPQTCGGGGAGQTCPRLRAMPTHCQGSPALPQVDQP